MKQLTKSILSVVVGLLTVSCSQITPTKSNTLKVNYEINDTIRAYEKVSNVMETSKSTLNQSAAIKSFTSTNYKLPNQYVLYNGNFNKRNFSYLPIVIGVLLTLSTCKLYLDKIDDDSVWMESELNRARKVKKK